MPALRGHVSHEARGALWAMSAFIVQGARKTFIGYIGGAGDLAALTRAQQSEPRHQIGLLLFLAADDARDQMNITR